MVEIVNNLYVDESNVRFECEDIWNSSFIEFFDIYFFCGVLYFYLINDEFYKVFKMIVINICKYYFRCVVVVDVLGCYSIEWIFKWNESCWDYVMSFFESEGYVEFIWMSFYFYNDL